MKLFTIIKKDFIETKKYPEAILLMVIFPIALTLVLGLAFQNLTSTTELEPTEVAIVTNNHPMSEFFMSQGQSAKLDFKELSQEDVDKKVSNGDLNLYIKLKDDHIELLHNENTLSSGIVSLYSRAFISQSNLATYLAQKNRLDLMGSDRKDIVSVEGLKGKEQPGSFDYYGITMMTLIVMYSGLQSMNLLSTEAATGTIGRIKISPTNMNTVFIAKMISATLLTLIQVSIIIFINKTFFGVNYGNLLMVYATLIPYIVFATSLGVFCLMLLRKADGASALLNIITIVLIFIGGGYFALPDTGILSVLQKNTPVGMVNLGILDSVYLGTNDMIWKSVLINVGLAAIMLAFSFRSFLREDGFLNVSNH